MAVQYPFISDDNLALIERYLVDAAKEKSGKEKYRNSKLFSNDELLKKIEEMIYFVKTIQMEAEKDNYTLNIDMEKLN